MMVNSILIFLLLSLPQCVARFGHPLYQISSLRRRLTASGDFEEFLRYERDVRTSRLATASGKLVDYFDSEIIANISIGTPEQPFSVFLDTMSANLWIQGVECTSCSTKKHSYNSSASSTFEANGRPIVIRDTTDMKGVLQEDTVQLGAIGDKQVVIPKQVFAVASEVSDDWKSAPTLPDPVRPEGQKGYNKIPVSPAPPDPTRSGPKLPAEGVLGLGFTPLAVDNVHPPLLNAIDQGLLDQPLFTIWLSPRSAYAMQSSGYVTYGEIDTENCNPVIGYAEVTVPIYFEFKMTGVSLGNQTYPMKKVSVVSDPSFSTITGPSDAIDFLAAKAGATWDYQYQIFTIDCHATPDPVIFTIGGHDYPVNYNNYIVTAYIGQGKCQLAFNSLYSTGFGTSWYLGSPFVRQYCHIYDYGKQRVGFAVAK